MKQIIMLILLKKITLPFAVMVLFVSVIVFLAAPWISDILCGVEFRECIPLIRIMTLVILFGEINYMIGLVGLVNMNRSSLIFRSVIITGVFSVVFILIFAERYGAYAAATSMSLSEFLLTLLCLASILRIRRES